MILQDLTMKQWIDKYIPLGSRRRTCRRSGVDKNTLRAWQEKKCQPSVLLLSYIVEVLVLEQNVDYNTVLLEGIKAAAKIGEEQ